MARFFRCRCSINANIDANDPQDAGIVHSHMSELCTVDELTRGTIGSAEGVRVSVGETCNHSQAARLFLITLNKRHDVVKNKQSIVGRVYEQYE